MPQVSRPLLIALLAVVGFAGVWMIVLRPRAQGETRDTAAASPAVTAPGAAGLGRAITKAHGASSASAASDRSTQQAAEASTGGSPTSAPTPSTTPPGTAPSTAVKATPPAAKSARPRPTVLLFAGAGADDAVARRVVRSVRRRGVHTITATIDQLARYRSLTGDITIESLPTILVIGADHRARRIAGLPDRAQVEQAIDSASR